MIPSNISNAVEVAKAISEKKFRLLCPQMCLAPIRTNNPDEANLKGIGTIETTSHGNLRYCMAFEQILPIQHCKNMDIPPAHVESIDELYRLVATDSSGREWRSTPVKGRFHPMFNPPDRGEVVESIDAISYRDFKPKNPDTSVVLIFSNIQGIRPLLSGWTRQTHTRGDKQILLSMSADHCQYQAEECDVFIEYTDEDILIVIITPKNEKMVPMGFEQRIIDALSFVVGQRFYPILSLRTQANHTDWHISRGPYIEPKGMIRPPVLLNSNVNSTDIWSLAAAYQNHIAKEWPDSFGTPDPISSALNEIYLGSQGTLYSSLRAVAIGIEAIGNAVNLRDRYPPKKKSNLKIDDIIEYIQQWNGDEVTCKFVISRLNDFKGPNFASYLYSFADAKSINHDVIKIWNSVRRRLAHGALDDINKLSPDDERNDVQDSVNSYYTMLGLAYQIIAEFIGYNGPLTDFSNTDWGII